MIAGVGLSLFAEQCCTPMCLLQTPDRFRYLSCESHLASCAWFQIALESYFRSYCSWSCSEYLLFEASCELHGWFVEREQAKSQPKCRNYPWLTRLDW